MVDFHLDCNLSCDLMHELYFVISCLQWEPAVENGLQKGYLTPQEKFALNRQLTSSILAHTESPSIHAKNHIALPLVQKYLCLKGSYSAGHVSVIT